MKVKGSLYWIYSFTSGCKGKMLVAILLAVIGVLCGMAPYFALAGILSGLIQNTLTAERIFCYVGIAVLGETLKMLFNTVSSLKAHRVAYHILGNIRCKLAEKMMRVPMGVMVDTPSGKLKAMVVDTVDKLEQPLAHMLPEITANVFTPLCIIILLFILDWRMALACMIVIPIGVLLLMGQMKDYKNRSDRYIEASSNMDSSLVEYVNGIEVIKTFSQTGKSFQKFSDAVKNYHDTTLDWWKNTWLYSALGLTVIPATLVGGIPVGAYPYKKRRELCYMTMQDVVHQLFSDSVWEEFSLLNKTVDEQEITKILRRLDLLDYKDKHPMTLSGGQKQRLALAVATLANKDIMIFDEPTSGLDYGNMIKVCELIKELSSNRIVFVATHDRELIGLLCTRRMEISNESISVYDLTTK